MNWKYCEEKLSHRVYWRASGQINGHLIELFVEDDWDYGMGWKVESGYYGTYFSKPKAELTLVSAREEAEAIFRKLEKTWRGKEYYE